MTSGLQIYIVNAVTANDLIQFPGIEQKTVSLGGGVNHQFTASEAFYQPQSNLANRTGLAGTQIEDARR